VSDRGGHTRIVEDALVRCNEELGRAAFAAEVVDTIVRQRGEWGTRSRYLRCQKILNDLSKAEVVKAWTVGNYRCYAWPGSLDDPIPVPSRPPLASQTFMARTLDTIRHCVEELDRGVRKADIDRALQDAGIHMPRSSFLNSIRNLQRKGYIHVVGRVRGNATDGSELYLPMDTSLDAVAPARPITRTDRLIGHIEELWELHEMAAEQGQNPRPLTISGIRQYLVERGVPDEFEPLSPKLQKLTVGAAPVLRAVGVTLRRRAHGYAPFGVDDEHLDLYSDLPSDGLKTRALVVSACARLEQPAVCLEEIRSEGQLRSELLPNQPLPVLINALTGASGEQSSGLYRAGRVRRRSYVCVCPPESPRSELRSDLSRARRFVAAVDLVDRMEEGWAEAIRYETQHQTCEPLAIGRLLSCARDFDHSARKAERLLAGGLPNSIAARTHVLLDRLRSEGESIGAVLSERLPSAWPVLQERRRWWTGQRFYAYAQSSFSRFDLSYARFLAYLIRDQDEVAWTQHPRFRGVRYGPRNIYDRTDSLIWLARRWGGPETTFQATLARAELGRLRDPQFALAGLRSPGARGRCAAIAALAFLDPPIATIALGHLFRADREPGVRRSALWAIGLHQPRRARELAMNYLGPESARILLRFASEAFDHDRPWTDL
jgi:hypothetical protein